jgi:HD-GYP domain-containing protein (c-di-GMP phosphodiesterase class II)
MAEASIVARPAPPSRRFLWPLQAASTLGVVALLLLVVSVLSWQSYRSSQEALISASDDTVSYIQDAIDGKLRSLLDPARVQLGFLIRGELSEATTLPDRLRQVPLMADALKQNELVESIYIGYPDGEFVLFRLLGDNRVLRSQFQAPPQTVLVVQSITPGADGTMIGEYHFFDANNALIGTRTDPDYRYDPRTRRWYLAAIDAPGPILTDPYLFFTNRKIGITLAQRTVDGGGVIGLDLRVRELAAEIQDIRVTPSTEMALVNDRRQVVAYNRGMDRAIFQDRQGQQDLATIDELNVPPLTAAAKLAFGDSLVRRETAKIDGRKWQIIVSKIEIAADRKLELLIAIPNDEFFATARSLVLQQFLIVGLIMLLAIPAAWGMTRLASMPLRRLAGETRRIEALDFSSEERVRSRFREIDNLGRGLNGMKLTIRKFLNIGRALAAEQEFKPLLDRLLLETIDLVKCDGGIIYMLGEDHRTLTPEIARWIENGTVHEEAGLPSIMVDQGGIAADIAEALRSKDIVVREHSPDELEASAPGLGDMLKALNATRVTLVTVPLLDRNKIPFGVMLLTKCAGAGVETWAVDEKLIQLIYAVSGSASVAIQNKLLLDAQRNLTDSLIKLVAGAIDAKSPYTGGHCQRVPLITRLLAQAAADQKTGPFQSFELSKEEWEALHIAAWLHDCGKVTTPEYVADKATKLETICDRIHEVRMRFELLKSAAETAYWKGLAKGGDEATLRARMTAEQQALDEDFAFVAACNEGGEFLEPAKIERIKSIAARRWTRTLSNRLGTSYEEKARFDRQPEPPLPAEEPLLADRADHVIEISEREIIPPDNEWGFKLNMPQMKYNRGEVYNLCIQRGTLTEEERYRINDHIVQTVIMLESLPFPKHLRNVPELAGGHHEKMDGTGYPKRLKGEEMSVVARIMAIADVFEALTAADRPYKKAKKLSEAIKIMGFMKKDRHLDPDLLDLFLTSGVWREYASRFLAPEQVDEPDINAILGIRPAA